MQERGELWVSPCDRLVSPAWAHVEGELGTCPRCGQEPLHDEARRRRGGGLVLGFLPFPAQ